MITRSDPGGSVPRFMVERGTPSSIVADASKFLDWACQKDEPEDDGLEGDAWDRTPTWQRRESFLSWQANGHLAGLYELEKSEAAARSSATDTETFPDIPSPTQSTAQTLSTVTSSQSVETSKQSHDHTLAASGILASVTGVLGTYAPQAVLDHLPASISTHMTISLPAPLAPTDGLSAPPEATDDAPSLAVRSNDPVDNDDAESTISTLTFASADSHLMSDEGHPSMSSASPPVQDRDSNNSAKPIALTPEEKEKANFAKRKAALDAKLAAAKEKYAKDISTQSEKVRKIEEKHRKEVEKEEEKHRKQLAKHEERRQKEEKKEEERRKKEAEKDEKTRLIRERDESRKEVELLKKQVDLLTVQIGDLQKENGVLMARIGKLESGESVTGLLKLKGDERKENRSRSSSLKRVIGGESI